MMWLMNVSGAESVAASSNVFLGQSEAILVISKYVPTLTRSECMKNTTVLICY